MGVFVSIKQQKQESKLFQQLLEAKGTAFDIKDSTGDIMISYVYEELNELVEALINYENEYKRSK